MSYEVIAKLTRDLANSSKTLSRDEARFLVKSYYTMQDNRIRANNQVRKLSETEQNHEVISWLAENNQVLENNIKLALDKFSDAHKVGEWSKSIIGIGPVLSAGLISHINIEKAPTVGHIWSYAGIWGHQEWKKGQKIPWNADLKVLCWKIGESFVKQSGHKDDIYGKLYLIRKSYEEAKNERLEYKDQATKLLEKFTRDTKSKTFYKEGKLPPGHIHSRCKRYAVKIFLSHWHHVAYNVHYGKDPVKPFAIAILNHAHEIPVPNWPMSE